MVQEMAQAKNQAIHVVYFGMTGAFSGPSLEALLAAGYDVRAIVTPQLAGAPAMAPIHTPQPERHRRAALPQLTPPVTRTLRQIADERAIPLHEIASLRHAETQAMLAAYEPDAICVACFSQRIPSEVLRMPLLGCLNVHPSLLPENRGPDPLFWTFRRGESMTGVTVHLMDEGFDSGPLLLQETVPVPDGIGVRALEEQLAVLGGKLLVRALDGLATGTLRPIPQDSARATSYPLPNADDCLITPAMPARTAFNFASGLLAYWPMLIQVDGQSFRLLAPLDYDAQATMENAWRLDGDLLTLRCTPGAFRARVAPIQ